MYLKNGGFCRLIVESTVFRLVFLLFDAFSMCCVTTVTRHLQPTRTQVLLSRCFVIFTRFSFYWRVIYCFVCCVYRVEHEQKKIKWNWLNAIMRSDFSYFLFLFYLTMFRLSFKVLWSIWFILFEQKWWISGSTNLDSIVQWIYKLDHSIHASM